MIERETIPASAKLAQFRSRSRVALLVALGLLWIIAQSLLCHYTIK